MKKEKEWKKVEGIIINVWKLPDNQGYEADIRNIKKKRLFYGYGETKAEALLDLLGWFTTHLEIFPDE